MKAIKVQYTVKPEYTETNKANIRKVMDRLKKRPIDGIRYSTFILDDGVTFVHINMAAEQKGLDQLQEMQEFIDFRVALLNSNPVSPPKSENMNLVAAGFDL